MKAIVHFVTREAGSYKWLKSGQNRGHWRVTVVHDPTKSYKRNAKNVVQILWEGRQGIYGVTKRSAYCLDSDRFEANRIADQFNSTHA